MRTLRKVYYEKFRHDGSMIRNKEYIFASSEKDAYKKLLNKHPEAFFNGMVDSGIKPVKRTLKDINAQIESNQREDFREHKLFRAGSGFWGNYCVFADPITEVDKWTEDDIYEYTKHFTEGKPAKGDYDNIKIIMHKRFPNIDYRIGVRSTYYAPQFDPEPTGVDSVEYVETVKVFEKDEE